MKRSGLVGQRVEDFQHDGAAHGIVAGPCGERARVRNNKAGGFLSACLFTKGRWVVLGIPNHKYKALNNSITALKTAHEQNYSFVARGMIRRGEANGQKGGEKLNNRA